MNYKYNTLALAIVVLLAGCGAEDNKDIGDDNNTYAPIVKGSVTIPALHVNLTVKGTYQYFDPNPAARPESKSLYSWRNGSDAELGTEQTFDLTYNHLGESLKFCVIPVSQGDINTVGDEVCSTARIIEEALGEKPVADSVSLDQSSPAVGETLTGSYNYSHPEGEPEGPTNFNWYADGEQITDANEKTLMLLPSQTEGKAIKFCVTPQTQVVIGDEVCSSETAPVKAISGSVPTVENVAIKRIAGTEGTGYVSEEFTGSYTFTDIDSDNEGASKRVWKRDGAAITGATEITYTAVNADEGTDLTFCITPISATGEPTVGIEACSETLPIMKKIEVPPVAASVTVSVQSGDTAEAGQVLVGSYTFKQSEGALEGTTVSNWVVDSAVTSCDIINDCEYSLTQADVGKEISFCVTPVTLLSTPGTEACSVAQTVAGIKISGKLEYDQQLSVVVYGYEGDVATDGSWMIDVGNQLGPFSESSPTSQGTGATYQIGVREGTLTDKAWVERPDGLDARNFIGKSVKFCLGERCVSAADSADVTGGVYYEGDYEGAVKPLRGIEPVKEYIFGSSTYHRSLTLVESILKEKIGLGANIPTAVTSTSINGIEWAIFTQVKSVGNNKVEALDVCRYLYADTTDAEGTVEMGEWHLPIGYMKADSRYLTNRYSEAGYDNNPPTVAAESLLSLDRKIINSTYDSHESTDDKKLKEKIHMSRVFGWPTSTNNTSATPSRVSYATATEYVTGTHAGKTYTVRLYNWGSASSNATTSTGQFVSCVK